MKKPIYLFIPAAGKGSRFTEVGIQTPKPLIPIKKIPMIIWVLSNFPLETEDEIYILCQKQHAIPHSLSHFIDKLKNKVNFLEIDYWTEGPAHSLELMIENLDESRGAICANSDQYISSKLDDFIKDVRMGNSHGQILTMEAYGPAWSYLGRDSQGLINQVEEKKQISNEATVGIYGWSSMSILREALFWQRTAGERVNNEYFVAPSYRYLIENHMSISSHHVGKHQLTVHGLGTPEDLIAFESSKADSEKAKFREMFLDIL